VPFAWGWSAAVVVEFLVIRPLRERSVSAGDTSARPAVGIAQILVGISLLPALQPDPTALVQRGYPLPLSGTVAVGGVVLNGASILTAILVPIPVVALAVFLRFTMLGRTIRAASSNPDAARLVGSRPVGCPP